MLGQTTTAQAELDKIRAERAKVEAEIRRLQAGGAAPAPPPPALPGPPANGAVPPAPGYYPQPPSGVSPFVVVLALGGLATVGYFVFRKKGRRR